MTCWQSGRVRHPAERHVGMLKVAASQPNRTTRAGQAVAGFPVHGSNAIAPIWHDGQMVSYRHNLPVARSRHEEQHEPDAPGDCLASVGRRDAEFGEDLRVAGGEPFESARVSGGHIRDTPQGSVGEGVVGHGCSMRAVRFADNVSGGPRE